MINLVLKRVPPILDASLRGNHERILGDVNEESEQCCLRQVRKSNRILGRSHRTRSQLQCGPTPFRLLWKSEIPMDLQVFIERNRMELLGISDHNEFGSRDLSHCNA